jgi:hypothetical protein
MLVTVASLGGAAVAGEPAPDVEPLLARVQALEALVAEHAKGDAEAALAEDAKAVVALHKEAGGEDPCRARLVKVLGTLVRERSQAVRQAAILAIGETRDQEAGKLLKPFLRPVTQGAVPPLLEPAIRAAALAPHDSLVEPLLEVVEDSKALGVAAAAMESLGAFGECKRKRTKILEDLVKTVERVRPGGPQRGKENQTNPDAPLGNNQGSSASERWNALAPVLPKALNQLTGQKFLSHEDWFAIVKENKRGLGRLFKEEE